MRLLYAAAAAFGVLVTIATPATAATARQPTFVSETAYLNVRPPHPHHAIHVNSAAALTRATAHARAGQTIIVNGRVVIPGEFLGFNRVVPGGVVKVVFQRGVRFTGGAGSRLPSVYISGAGGWRIWGGAITNPSGSGILVHATPGPVTWTGFTVSNTAETCVSVFPASGNVTGVTLKGRTGTASPNLAFDPHAEKGTGIHAWNIGDATDGVVENSTFAADVVNQATGGAVQIDTSHIGANVRVYARARHIGFPVPGTGWDGRARQQTAGNVVQLWGASPPGNLQIKYEEGGDIQGRMLETSGIQEGADLSHVTVDYARITGPILLNKLMWSRAVYAVTGGLHLGTTSRRRKP